MSEPSVNDLLKRLQAKTGVSYQHVEGIDRDAEPASTATQTIDPADEEAERQRWLLEQQPRESAPPPPRGYESRVPEREPLITDVSRDGEDHGGVDDGTDPFGDAGGATDHPPAASVEGIDYDDLGAPTAVSNDGGAPSAPGSTAKRVLEQVEQAEWMQENAPDDDGELYPDQHQEFPPEVSSRNGGDDDGSPRGEALKAKAAPLLERVKEWVRRNPRPVIIAAFGLVIALVIALLTDPGDPSAEQNETFAPPPPSSEPVSGEGGNGEPVQLLPYKVSGRCGPGETDPSLVFTAKPQEAWVCPRAHNADGAILNIFFRKNVIVTRIDVVPGFNYVAPNGKDHWNEHRVVTEILWRIGGHKFPHPIDPTRAGSQISINPPKGISTASMSMTVVSTARPDAADAGIDPESSGGILPPLIGPGDNTDVDKTFAISNLVIWGYEQD